MKSEVPQQVLERTRDIYPESLSRTYWAGPSLYINMAPQLDAHLTRLSRAHDIRGPFQVENFIQKHLPSMPLEKLTPKDASEIQKDLSDVPHRKLKSAMDPVKKSPTRAAVTMTSKLFGVLNKMSRLAHGGLRPVTIRDPVFLHLQPEKVIESDSL